MGFTNLSQQAQEVLLVQFSFFFKFSLLLGSLAFAVFYLFYWKKEKEQPTVFYSVAIMRTIITISSWLILIFSPILLVFLSPEYALETTINTVFPIYLTFIVLCAIGLMIDLFYYTPTLLIKFSGIDIQDKRVRKAYKVVKTYFRKNGN